MRIILKVYAVDMTIHCLPLLSGCAFDWSNTPNGFRRLTDKQDRDITVNN